MIVLVVEDEVLVNLNIAEALRDDGLETVQAYTAEEALAVLATRGDISVVFTDINLPGKIDGIALASEIQLRWPEIEVLMTSGRRLPGFDGGDLVTLHVFFFGPFGPGPSPHLLHIITAPPPAFSPAVPGYWLSGPLLTFVGGPPASPLLFLRGFGGFLLFSPNGPLFSSSGEAGLKRGLRSFAEGRGGIALRYRRHPCTPRPQRRITAPSCWTRSSARLGNNLVRCAFFGKASAFGGRSPNNGDAHMNSDIIQGNWTELKGKVQKQWGKLTDDDLDKIEGKRKNSSVACRSVTATRWIRPRRK